ncbi:MAG: acyl carrier protein [Candidatus Bathyarchaeia archaeon]
MTIEEIVKEIIADVFKKKVNELSFETSFVDDLHAKSVQIIELLALLEDKFNISIPFAEVKKNKTIGEAIEYIKGKLGN